jgi:5'-nucleotidase
MADRPLILVSNDDGVYAPGLIALREAVADLGEVVTVAPLTEQSAGSHSLTLSRPLRHREIAPGVHSIDGTPADCIYIALFHEHLLQRRPDLVLSGINHGPNLGSDVFYSGTVAAAREASLRGIPAIAFSNGGGVPMGEVAALARRLVTRLLAATLPPGQAPLLSVNVPAPPIRGIRATKLGRRLYDEVVVVRQDPRGRDYLWIGGPKARHELVEGSDTEAFDAGYVSVTPLHNEGTHAEHLGIAAWVAGSEPM